MTPILAFDTSGRHCAASLHVDERKFFWRSEKMERGQAERLMPMLEELLEEAALTWRDLGALAVGIGPGNFTGIRISVSAARGLSMSLAIPAVGVSLFEIRSLFYFDMPDPAELILVCLHGPRETAYVQLSDRQGPVAAARQFDPNEDTLEGAERDATAVGPASHLFDGLLVVDGRANSSARTLNRMVHIARQRLGSGSDIERPAPLYVKPPDAAPSRITAPEIRP